MANTAWKRRQSAFNKKVRAAHARIQASNAQFKGATKAQRRVQVAKDAIEWMKMGMFLPDHGGYVNLSGAVYRNGSFDLSNISPAKQLDQQILERVQKPSTDENSTCQVCGVGGLLVATVMRYDDFALTRASVRPHDKSIGLSKRACNRGLSGLFSNSQLAMIETAFEKWRLEKSHFDNLKTADRKRAYQFGKRFTDASDRFGAIMRNIIKNEGLFKP